MRHAQEALEFYRATAAHRLWHYSQRDIYADAYCNADVGGDSNTYPNVAPFGHAGLAGDDRQHSTGSRGAG